MTGKGRFPIMSQSGNGPGREPSSDGAGGPPQGRGSGGGSGGSGDEGTMLGLGSGGAKPIMGKPSLTMMVNNKETDLWNTVLVGAAVKQIEQILSRSKADSAYDMTAFIRGVEYQGFDRLFYIKHALTKMSVSVFARFAIIGAIRGSNFTKICDSCETMPGDLISGFTSCGFVKTPKRRTDLTILRNTASIPHWCAYWNIKAVIVKKIPTNDCDSALQFPGAASLPMSRTVRMNHLRFCSEFSQLLPGGRFNLNIYLTAMKNSIPVTDIPAEVLSILEVSAGSESYSLRDDDMAPYSQAMVRAR